ncbi:MAG TPA: ParA family protein [Anaerolineales bacterium]|nr:ParA family protein [Anaerolineales bacterium]
MSFLIAVANHKGGVAKTTTTFSLGGTLAHAGYEVLLVDLDCQANLTQACGVDPLQTSGSIINVFYDWASLTGVSRATHIPGMDLVPSHPSMEFAERFLPIRKNYETILQNVSHRWLNYDYVIFDCPPSLGAVTTNALNAADLLIIPVTPEIFSLEALKKMLNIVEHTHQTSNSNLQYRLLVTMLDIRLRIHTELYEFLRDRFSDSLFKQPIQIDTKLRESVAAGSPIITYSPHSRSALQYQALSEEIHQHARQDISSSIRKTVFQKQLG